ncbi:MAG: acyl-CoA dehydrogenase [Streptosporangiales bacterium]|nr:acyl-CoA dehydrogenase [Streptosporangiales bacterium]
MVETPERDQIGAQALAWLEQNWDPEFTVREWWARLAESGWGFPTWPREWFGRGLPAESAAAVREAFTKVGALGPPASLGQLLGGPTLLTHASDEQRARFLPALARGEEFWCQFFSEPSSGSDLASLRTRAVRRDDGWVVNGQKVWTSGAQFADRGMLAARTDPDVPKHRGITYFIIDLDQPGVEVRPLHQMSGAHGFNEVFFTDAWVADDRIVGELGGGWAVATTTLMFERFMTSLPSASPGRHSAHLDLRAGDVADGKVKLEREGSPYASASKVILDVASRLGKTADPVTRGRLAALLLLERTNAYSGMRQADAVRAGRRPGAEGSARKITRSNLARTARDVGMDTLGAYGMLAGEDTPGGGAVQDIALSSPGASIAGGTDEIQRNIIGERVLGLPKEPRIDRDVPFRDLTVGTAETEKPDKP